MRDLTYDFLKGALGLDAGKAVLKKHNWLGIGVAGFATGYLSAASGAVVNAAMSQGKGQGLSAKMQARLLKVQALWGVQRVMEIAAAGALDGAGHAMPVLVHMQVDAPRALQVLRARGGSISGGSRGYIKRRGRSGAKIRMSLLTDTDTLRAIRGDLNAAIGDPGAGAVKMGPEAKAATAGVGTLALSEEKFLQLYARESKLGTQAVGALRDALKSGTGLQAKTIALSVPGRLALGSVLVQGLGLINGLYALKQAGNDKEIRDAWYGVYNSTAGTVGGLLEVWAVVREASTGVLLGKAAVEKSASIGALKVVGFVAGAVGSAVNAFGAWAKADDADQIGEAFVANLYLGSFAAFSVTTLTSTALAAGALADTLVARGIGGAAVEAIAARVGATGVLTVVGGTAGIAITVSGIGLVLLGAGMALQIGAIALTPTPMQRWLSRSYFGKDSSKLSFSGKRSDMFAKGDWDAEFKALQEAMKSGGKEPDSDKPSLAEKAKTAVRP